MALKIKSKSKKPSSRRPMVPTTDTMKLPNRGVVSVHVQKKGSPLVTKPTAAEKKRNPRKALMQSAFFRDGLSPEERLLKAVFGKKSGISPLPKELRTKERFARAYNRYLKLAKAVDNKSAKPLAKKPSKTTSKGKHSKKTAR